MANYCDSKPSATVDYSFNGIKDQYVSQNPPIDVEVVSTTSFCWRFAGQGVGNNSFYEYFASGTSPSFQSVNESGYTGLALYIDGNRLGEYGYIYRSGTQSVNRIQESIPSSGYVTSGSCSAAANCSIKITDKKGNIFMKSGNCPIKFTVACGDECPEGYCKIDCEAYPGYCCINEAEIQSLSNQLR